MRLAELLLEKHNISLKDNKQIKKDLDLSLTGIGNSAQELTNFLQLRNDNDKLITDLAKVTYDLSYKANDFAKKIEKSKGFDSIEDVLAKKIGDDINKALKAFTTSFKKAKSSIKEFGKPNEDKISKIGKALAIEVKRFNSAYKFVDDNLKGI